MYIHKTLCFLRYVLYAYPVSVHTHVYYYVHEVQRVMVAETVKSRCYIRKRIDLTKENIEFTFIRILILFHRLLSRSPGVASEWRDCNSDTRLQL